MAPKRSSRAPTTPATLSHHNGQGVRERWPVLVYRLQSHRGWEVYSDPNAEAAQGGKNTNAKKALKGGDYNGSNSRSESSTGLEELTATPRVGCIEVRKIRLRIQLFQQHTRWNPSQPLTSQRGGDNRAIRGKEIHPNSTTHHRHEKGSAEEFDKAADDEKNLEEDYGYDSDAPGADGWNNNSLLVRRRDTLLVTTRRGMGAVVFRFKSVQECIEFCDRLVHLNWESLMPRPCEASGLQDTESSKLATFFAAIEGGGCAGMEMDGRDLRVDDMNGVRRHMGATFRDTDGIAERKLNKIDVGDSGSGAEIWMREQPPGKYKLRRRCQRHEKMLSYIIKLAHSEDFSGFVDELERGLELAMDATAIAALGF